jgi:predicted dehydrogenase
MSTRRRRGALVGYGFIAENGHLPAYAASDDFEIVAVADVCAARREAASKALPHARIYEDHRSLLALEAKGLDFLDVTTPPYAHATISREALESGLHVLCEKPLAITVADARAALEQAERSKRVLFPAHNYKHAPVIKAVRQAVDAGLIGTVHSVTMNTFRNTHARGVREWNEHWRRERRYSGGGIAMDHGPHTFYLAFDWLRSYPTAITAKITTRDVRGAGDTEDTLVSTLTFPTGIATAHLTWTAGIRKVIYTLHGDRGAIRVEDDDVEVAVMAEAHGDARTTWELNVARVSSEWMDAGHSVWFQSLFAQFAAAMDQRDYAGKEAQDALRCLEVITGAYQSARDGCAERPLGTGA